MKLVELFSGTGTLAATAKEMGWEVMTVDYDEKCGADFCTDFTDRDQVDELAFFCAHVWKADMVWASPPCESFSVASIGTHWGGGHRAYQPKTTQARNALTLIENLAWFIEAVEPTVWYIENPRGVMRKVAEYERIPGPVLRHTITYCQYGEERMKPTDIWTNNQAWLPRPPCKNGDPCHEAAPRGSKTGTQGRKSYLDRSRLPVELCEEVMLTSIEYINWLAIMESEVA